MTSGIPGSAWKPTADTEIRLARWRRMAAQGIPVNDIAAACGMKRSALRRLLSRARSAGHPDAVQHAGYVPPGSGTWQLTGRAPRRTHRPGGSDAR